MFDKLAKADKVMVVTTKRGKVTGRGQDKKRRGADKVAAVVRIGVDYLDLVKDSKALCEAPNFINEVFEKVEAKGVTFGKNGDKPTLEDVALAVAETIASFDRTLNPDPTVQPTRVNPYKPLVWNGETIRGVKVYDGTGEGGVGDMHIYGLIEDKKVLEADEPIPASVPRKGTTAVKPIIRRMLPIAKWVQYTLVAGTEYRLVATDVDTEFSALKGV